MTELLSLLSEDSTSTFAVVLLTAIGAWLKQRSSAQESALESAAKMQARLAEIDAGAEDVALGHLQRSSDRLLDELTGVQSRFLDALGVAADLQGQMTEKEKECSELRDRVEHLEKEIKKAVAAAQDTDEFFRGK